MKSRNTRKINRKKRGFKGGQSTQIPYANTNPTTIQTKLTNFQQDANTLASWASQYRTATIDLNNDTRMNEHRRLANSLAGQAHLMYEKAQDLWTTVYGSRWNPPSPAPAPSLV